MGIRYNGDEEYIRYLVNTIPGVNARPANSEEDCGFRKADVVVDYRGREYYLRVSRTQKSGRQRETLLKRGTFPVATHKFERIRVSDDELKKSIKEYLDSK